MLHRTFPHNPRRRGKSRHLPHKTNGLQSIKLSNIYITIAYNDVDWAEGGEGGTVSVFVFTGYSTSSGSYCPCLYFKIPNIIKINVVIGFLNCILRPVLSHYLHFYSCSFALNMTLDDHVRCSSSETGVRMMTSYRPIVER